MSHYQVVVVGGGNAGISVAARLLKEDSSLNIAIIEPSESHYYQPAWTLVGGGSFDINKTRRSEASVIPKGATWIKDAVLEFQPTQNTVTTTSGNSYGYDYLVVAPGIQLNWHHVLGLPETMGKSHMGHQKYHCTLLVFL